MTTDYHNVIPSDGQPANASVFNGRFADLDEAIAWAASHPPAATDLDALEQQLR